MTTKLFEYMKINDYAIELVDDCQILYYSIYSLGLAELETLKAYIENNLTNDFIKLFKSSIKALILFNKKPNGSFRLYLNYQGLNNLIIKN